MSPERTWYLIKNKINSVYVEGREEERKGGAEGRVRRVCVKSRPEVKTRDARGGRVLPDASDKLKTFFQSPRGPESETPACHQSHSIWCQGHVPKIQGREETPWLTQLLHDGDARSLPNPTCPPGAHRPIARLSDLQQGVDSSPSPTLQYSAPGERPQTISFSSFSPGATCKHVSENKGVLE